MGKYGRPKLSLAKRRTHSLPQVRVNAEELAVIEANARAAGQKVTAWMRFAAQKRRPPAQRVTSQINIEAWRKLGELSSCLVALSERFEGGENEALLCAIETLRDELRGARNSLLGAAQE